MANPKAPKSNEIPIMYLGDDNTYWTTIKSIFVRDYPKLKFAFINKVPYGEELEGQLLYRTILKYHPKIIYLDFSTNFLELESLCKVLMADFGYGPRVVLGLIDKKETLQKAKKINLEFYHYKGGEYHDVVFDAIRGLDKALAHKPTFALAKFYKPDRIYSTFRISFITTSMCHAEGNLRFDVGETIELENHIPVKLIPSKKMIVKKIYTNDLYFGYQYGYDLEFVWVDEPPMEDEEFEDALGEEDAKKAEEVKRKARAERQKALQEVKAEIRHCKKSYAKWVSELMMGNPKQKVKVLIVDGTYQFLTQESMKPVDKYPYVVRCASGFSETMDELDMLRPGLLVIQLYSPMALEEMEMKLTMFNEYKRLCTEAIFGDGTLNPLAFIDEAGQTADPEGQDWEALKENILALENEEMERLHQTVQKIKGIEGYSPFIVLFNCFSKQAKELQDIHQYPYITTFPNHIHFDAIMKMAQTFQIKHEEKTKKALETKLKKLKQKDIKKYGRLTIEELEESKYFISANEDFAWGRGSKEIAITKFTESEITIASDENFVRGAYELEFPFKMGIANVGPIDKDDKDNHKEKFRYKFLIHSMNESKKKLARRYVNEIFFMPVTAEREAEQADYWTAHAQALQEKMGAIQQEEGVSAEDLSDGDEEEEGEEGQGDGQSSTGK